MRGDFFSEAMQYRSVDLAAQRRAEEEMMTMTKTTMRAGGGQCSGYPCQTWIGQGDACYHEPRGDSGKLYCGTCGERLMAEARAAIPRAEGRGPDHA